MVVRLHWVDCVWQIYEGSETRALVATDEDRLDDEEPGEDNSNGDDGEHACMAAVMVIINASVFSSALLIILVTNAVRLCGSDSDAIRKRCCFILVCVQTRLLRLNRRV